MSHGFPRPMAARQHILLDLPWMRTQVSKRPKSSSVHIPVSVIGISGVRIYRQIALSRGGTLTI